jgi:hypothetical protein
MENKSKLSIVEPDFYQKRFVNFIKRKIFPYSTHNLRVKETIVDILGASTFHNDFKGSI